MEETRLTDVITVFYVEHHNAVIVVTQSPTGVVKRIDTTYSTDYIN
jgi:hypothetical protein